MTTSETETEPVSARQAANKRKKAAVAARETKRVKTLKEKTRARTIKNEERRKTLYAWNPKELLPHIRDIQRMVRAYLNRIRNTLSPPPQPPQQQHHPSQLGDPIMDIPGLRDAGELFGGQLEDQSLLSQPFPPPPSTSTTSSTSSTSSTTSTTSTTSSSSEFRWDENAVQRLTLETFKTVWKEMKMSYIHQARLSTLDPGDFLNGMATFILPYFVLPGQKLHAQVTMLYLLYVLHGTQDPIDKAPLRVTLPIFTTMRTTASLAFSIGLSDPFYVLQDMWLKSDAFSFHATISLGVFEDSLKSSHPDPIYRTDPIIRAVDSLSGVFDTAGVKSAHKAYVATKEATFPPSTPGTRPLFVIEQDVCDVAADELLDLQLQQHIRRNTRISNHISALASRISQAHAPPVVTPNDNNDPIQPQPSSLP